MGSISPEYLLIPPVSNILEGIMHKLEEQLKQCEKDIEDAKALGDLSENATYYNSMNIAANLRAVISNNRDYLSQAKVLSGEKELESYGYGNLYKEVSMTITDPKDREAVHVNAVITPSIVLNIGAEQLWISSDIGWNLLNNISPDWSPDTKMSFWIDIDGKKYKVSVNKVGPYKWE